MRFRIILNLDKARLLHESSETMKDIKARTVFVPPLRDRGELSESIATAGLRPTPQRAVVYGVLMDRRDHPTADEVFVRAKQEKPDISIATVYNCLDALVKCHLVKQVNLDRAATRYCPNMKDHVHFQCESCGGITDVAGTAKLRGAGLKIPSGFTVNQTEMSLRGLCPDCTAKQ